MLVEASIVGGYIKMHKDVFIQEMLIKDSLVRLLLDWRKTKGFTDRHPFITESDKNNIVTIDFTNNCVSVGESPKDILGVLKLKYREKIKGRVACKLIYSTFSGLLNSFEIDLNSEDGNIDYIN